LRIYRFGLKPCFISFLNPPPEGGGNSAEAIYELRTIFMNKFYEFTQALA